MTAEAVATENSSQAVWKSPGLGCAACGSCCDPVTVRFDDWARLTSLARSDETGYETANPVFIAAHMRPVRAAVCKDDGEVWIDLRCDAFDLETRLCTAREDRPPMCRDFPWYGDDPASRARLLSGQCSYQFDVAPADRPEGSRPLIPLTVVTK